MTERLEEHQLELSSERVDADVHKVFRDGVSLGSEDSSDVIERAVQRLRNVEGLRQDAWEQLDEYGRRTVLNAAGREVADVLEHPAPPLHVQDMQDPLLRGTYGDGYRSGRDGEIEGSDYRISMNEQALSPGEGVLGDDPRAALETYLHEFRHSYQFEQVARFDKPQFHNLVDNHALAEAWSKNIQDYKSPEFDYESYYNQPLESDARDFASQVRLRLFFESGDQR